MPNSSKNSNAQLRLRVFAGPNGSGKSTVIESIRNTEVNGKKVDFGYYINADIITKSLMNTGFSFSSYGLRFSDEKFIQFAATSGLLNEKFTAKSLQSLYSHTTSGIKLKKIAQASAEQLGQVIARFLREEMLRLKRRFSFETVFSHESNLDIMRRAAELGYKVYLYFVGTESPEINKYRVKLRVAQDGHDVPPDKIEKRYSRSLQLMYPASAIAYQAYFFDNSIDGQPFKLAAHFKRSGTRKKWDKLKMNDQPFWFKKYNKKIIANN